jgi:flagellar basal-body rod protein FlgG
MLRALYTAASGMQAQQTNLDTIANNLANSSTSGFRSSRMQFQDLIYQNIIMPGAAASQQTTVEAGLQVGLGTRASASEVLQLQGDLTATGNQLDIAIEGNGFFQVLLPSGETAYTRAGSFHTDAQGNVVTADGNPLQPAITIPQSATTVTIAADGTVSVTVPGQTAAQQVGSIQLALFPNPGGLSSSGGSLFLATTASGDAVVGTPGGSDGLGQVEQGYLEQSNVSVVDEFINMIVAQRSYEASSRVVQAADQMFQLINNLGH